MTVSNASPNDRGLAAARPVLAPLLAMPLLLLPLFLLGGCFSGGAPAGMDLTMEETVAEPQPEPGPIKFVWEGDGDSDAVVIGTTTSTTSAPTAAVIARKVIAEHRSRPVVDNRIQPVIDPTVNDQTLPQAGAASRIRLLPSNDEAAAVAGDVTVLGVREETIPADAIRKP